MPKSTLKYTIVVTNAKIRKDLHGNSEIDVLQKGLFRMRLY